MAQSSRAMEQRRIVNSKGDMTHLLLKRRVIELTGIYLCTRNTEMKRQSYLIANL